MFSGMMALGDITPNVGSPLISYMSLGKYLTNLSFSPLINKMEYPYYRIGELYEVMTWYI